MPLHQVSETPVIVPVGGGWPLPLRIRRRWPVTELGPKPAKDRIGSTRFASHSERARGAQIRRPVRKIFGKDP